MPNDDQTNTIKAQTTTAPPIFVDSGDAPPMLNTKPSADVINPSPVTINIDSSSVAPTNDIVTPIMPAVVTSGPPKKKYAGGKIIATILGLFLLVGGIGAGVYLTGQNQNIAEKAGEGLRRESMCTKPDGSKEWCWNSSDQPECGNDLGHPEDCTPTRWTNGYCTTITEVTEPCGTGGDGGGSCPEGQTIVCGDTPVTECKAHCPWPGHFIGGQEDADACGHQQNGTPMFTCQTNCSCQPPTVTPPSCLSATISKNKLTGPGDSLTITSTATSSDITGFLYGFYNLDNLYGPSNPKPIFFASGTGYTRADTVSPTNSHSITVTYDEINKPDLNANGQKPTRISVSAFFGNANGSTNSDPNCVVYFDLESSVTAQCQNIKMYDSNWTELVNTPMVKLVQKAGDIINFCVTGAATGGSFDKARFTIEGALQAETTTLRPGTTDFCQSFIIPTGTPVFNVSAEIHHNTLGWK